MTATCASSSSFLEHPKEVRPAGLQRVVYPPVLVLPFWSSAFANHLCKHSCAIQLPEKGLCADHEIRGKEMDLIIDFFEQNSVPDLERINGNTHDLVGQADSQAEVLIRKTGLQTLRHTGAQRVWHSLLSRDHSFGPLWQEL
jgi:hypothetical protein